jgi:hypothetical protein
MAAKAITEKDYVTAYSGNEHASEMTDLDREIAKANPALGIQLLDNKKLYYSSDDPFVRDYAHDLNEQIRSQYLASRAGVGQVLTNYNGTSAQSALKNMLDTRAAELNAKLLELDNTYGTARNRLSADGEITKRSMNEYAAAHGLGSGAGAQVRLSVDNQTLAGLSDSYNSQAQEYAALGVTPTYLESQYSGSIAEEIAKGDYEKARKLYNEWTLSINN